MVDRDALVSKGKLGYTLSFCKGWHCCEKYELKMFDFCRKLLTNKPFSISGGMFVYFFLLIRRLNAVQKIFDPLLASHSFLAK